MNLPIPSQTLVYGDPEMYNNRKRIPVSRIFNATLTRDLKLLLITIKNLESASDVIWWKVERSGDKYYVTGQRTRPEDTHTVNPAGGGLH